MSGRAERSTTSGAESLDDSPLVTWRPSVPEVAIGLVIAVLLRSSLAAWTIRQGYVEYNADGFARIIRGWEWLQAPRWEVEVWLPLQFWLYGAALAIWDNVLLTPRVLNYSLSVITIVLLFGIGARLLDRRAGLIAALLGAIFPFEIWLALSGMSEPLFHTLLALAVFGFISWWTGNESSMILVAGFALAAATAVRYEGWFFAVAFVPLVIGATWYQRRDLRYPAVACLLAVTFIAVWVQQNWQIYGDPVAFAGQTEAIKESENPSAAEASLLERVTFFPEAAFSAAPAVVLFGIIASAALLWWFRMRWAPFLALVWGQAIVLVGVTSMFSNEGPGAERYLLPNTVLLLVPIAALIWLLIDRAGIPGLLGAGALVAVLVLSFIPKLMSPPDSYPDDDTRDLATLIQDRLDEEPEGIAIVLLPAMPDERFNQSYALRVLSEYPGRVEITDQPSRLYEAVQEGTATIWAMDERVEAEEPPALERGEIGAYVAGEPPPPAAAVAEEPRIDPDDQVRVDASDFLPGEPIATWWTAPDGEVYAGPDLESDGDGAVEQAPVPLPSEAGEGEWSLTLSGEESLRRAYVAVEVVR